MQELSDVEKAIEIQRLLKESLQYQDNLTRLNQEPEKNAEVIKNNRIVLYAAAVRILLLLPEEINYFYFKQFPDIGAVRFPDRQTALNNLLELLEYQNNKSSDQDRNTSDKDSQKIHFDQEGLDISDLQIIRVLSFGDVLDNCDTVRRINPRITSQDDRAIQENKISQRRYTWEIIRDKVFKIIAIDVGAIRIYNDELACEYALSRLHREGKPPVPELPILPDYVPGEKHI